MLIGEISGRLVVAYDSVQQAKDEKSCITCIRYRDDVPCRMYAHCRASKGADEEPIMFRLASNSMIENRLTPVRRIELDGFKPCCV